MHGIDLPGRADGRAQCYPYPGPPAWRRSCPADRHPAINTLMEKELIIHSTPSSVEIAIPNDVAAGVLGPDPCAPLRLVDRLSGLPLTSCRPAEELARGMRFWMGPADRLYWAAFEACEPG
ncbi:MAG: hypothetical protein ACO3YQ_00840 [Flavobacteriales bacterium]